MGKNRYKIIESLTAKPLKGDVYAYRIRPRFARENYFPQPPSQIEMNKILKTDKETLLYEKQSPEPDDLKDFVESYDTIKTSENEFRLDDFPIEELFSENERIALKQVQEQISVPANTSVNVSPHSNTDTPVIVPVTKTQTTTTPNSNPVYTTVNSQQPLRHQPARKCKNPMDYAQLHDAGKSTPLARNLRGEYFAQDVYEIMAKSSEKPIQYLLRFRDGKARIVSRNELPSELIVQKHGFALPAMDLEQMQRLVD